MNTSEQIPPLAPPHPAIPPGFWEQHGTLVIILAAAAVLLLSVLVWLLLRPKAVVPVPPVVRARNSLEPLRGQPEDGQLLSRVSQVVRHYFTDSFSLGLGELTTSEVAVSLEGNPSATPEMALSVGQFLRACDERKFKQNGAAVPLEAVPRALNLIEQAEAHRAELQRQSEAAAARQPKPAVG